MSTKFIRALRGPFFSLILFALSLEVLSRAWHQFQTPPQEIVRRTHEWTVLTPGNTAKNPGVSALFAPPGTVYRHQIRPPKGDHTDVLYRIDENGLRKSTEVPGKKNRHLLLSGCSFTFGQGVREEETLASILSGMRPDSNVKNLGFPSGGLHTSLRLTEVINLRDIAPEEKGKFIYIMIPDHVKRWVPHLGLFFYPAGPGPYYEMRNGKLAYGGSMSEHPQTKLASYLRKSSAGRLFLRSLMSANSSESEADLDFFYEGIIELKKRYLSLYPGGEFVVLMHPLFHSPSVSQFMKRKSAEAQVTFYDAFPEFEKAIKRDGSSFLVNGDQHPSAKMNENLSKWISHRILPSP